MSPYWQHLLAEQGAAPSHAVASSPGNVPRDWPRDPPSRYSGALPRVALSVADLPEIRMLLDEGFELAPEASFLAFLPAIWPEYHRTWVVDRGTRYTTVTCTTGATSVVTVEPCIHSDCSPEFVRATAAVVRAAFWWTPRGSR